MTRRHERWAIDELERVMGADAIATPRADRIGGEWDALKRLPRSTKRRLTGARFLRADAMRPDVAADVIADRVAGIAGIDEAIDWYVATALVAIAQRRAIAHHARHQRIARQRGFRSYYANRVAMAHALGYRSVWQMRIGRGWIDDRRPAPIRQERAA